MAYLAKKATALPSETSSHHRWPAAGSQTLFRADGTHLATRGGDQTHSQRFGPTDSGEEPVLSSGPCTTHPHSIQAESRKQCNHTPVWILFFFFFKRCTGKSHRRTPSSTRKRLPLRAAGPRLHTATSTRAVASPSRERYSGGGKNPSAENAVKTHNSPTQR